jgi:hypothetical protein
LVAADLPGGGSGTGTVTSVAISAPSYLTVSGSPITGAGTISLTSSTIPTTYGGTGVTTAVANTIFAGPSSGSPLAPSFRILATTDLPQIPLSTGVTGTLPIANGGTGTTSTTANFVFAGPTSGSGAPSFRALTIGDMPGGFGTGSVTSVAMTVPAFMTVTGSPITTSGTFAVTMTSALPIANGGTGATSTSQSYAFIGPTSGSGAPSFRALVAGDLPTISLTSGVSGTLPIANGGTGATSTTANYVFAGPTSGSGAPSFRALTIGDMPGGFGTGSVTSVAMTVPAFMTVTGSPITTSGTFAITMSSALPISNGGTGLSTTSQNYAFIGPTSGSGAPSFRALVAGDIPAISLTSGVSGTLPVANGGTGTTSISTNCLAYGGASALTYLSAGTSGQILQSQGSGSPPTWVTSSIPTFSSGNWTPTISNIGTSTFTPTYSLQVGKYSIVNNYCTLSFTISFSMTISGGVSTTILEVRGVPTGCQFAAQQPNQITVPCYPLFSVIANPTLSLFANDYNTGYKTYDGKSIGIFNNFNYTPYNWGYTTIPGTITISGTFTYSLV